MDGFMQSFAIPQVLNDLNCNWGNDLVAFAGDLDTVIGAEKSQQRVLRRLLTAIRGYIWHVEYGAGLPGFVGQALSSDNFDQLKSLILSNMLLESSVAQNPPPVIALQSIANGIFCQINYNENPSQNPIVLSFDLGN
jgi:hypothetical protein